MEMALVPMLDTPGKIDASMPPMLIPTYMAFRQVWNPILLYYMAPRDWPPIMIHVTSEDGPLIPIHGTTRSLKTNTFD